MESYYLALLSTLVFLPAAGAVLLLLFPRDNPDAMKWFSLAVTAGVAVLAGWMADPFGWFGAGPAQFDVGVGAMQSTFSIEWIPSFGIFYFMGLDGISFPLVALTALVSLLACGASWTITKNVKAYFVLFLLLETGMLGVFLALDFFLFYVFWEVMLLPMYFLIGVWGGPRREYAAIKFFLYTLMGSVLMLIAILMLYFAGDLREVASVSDFRGPSEDARAVVWDDLHIHPTVEARLGRTTVPIRTPSGASASLLLLRSDDSIDTPITVDFLAVGNGAATDGGDAVRFDEENATLTVPLFKGGNSVAAVAAAMNAAPATAGMLQAGIRGDATAVIPSGTSVELVPVDVDREIHSFNLLALAAMGQHTELFDGKLLFGWSLQHWAFLLLLIGFLIKVPAVPLHTWLPDAHVEAPTPISMILAGVLLKMGGYGILRICYPICPHAGYDLAWLVCLIGAVSMVYGALAAMAQTDFKRLVAYSSVSHMGYVVLGLGVWSANAGTLYNADYWNMGVQGAMFQMIAHGISSAGMFFMVGVVYERVHHRDLNRFGALFGKMPVYTALAIGIFFAGLGLPGLCGFIGEVLVVLSIWKYSMALAVVAASVVILTAGYILWAVQRVYLGAEYKGPHGENLTPITSREFAIGAPLFVLAIWLGVYPAIVLNYMDKSITRQVETLAQWTAVVKTPGAVPDAIPPVETTDVAETDAAETDAAETDAAETGAVTTDVAETGAVETGVAEADGGEPAHADTNEPGPADSHAHSNAVSKLGATAPESMERRLSWNN